MATVTRLPFVTGREVRSLVWNGDRIVDLVGGGASVGVDGTTLNSRVHWGYPFDRAVLSPMGEVGVLYTALATKALVISTIEVAVLRELDRSFYCANVYEYPVTVGRTMGGEDVLIHCPDGYKRLAIERLVDGSRLASASEEASDVFHSRLALSPSGRYLLSAGWIWHPLGVAAVYDVGEALENERHLDGGGLLPWQAVDGGVEAACWWDDDRLVISTNPDEGALGTKSEGLAPGELGIWSVAETQWVSHVGVKGHTGEIHRLGEFVLALYEHPRLIDPLTGEVVAAWPEIFTGLQVGSIRGHDHNAIPPIAVDGLRNRFAVVEGGEVVLVVAG